MSRGSASGRSRWAAPAFCLALTAVFGAPLLFGGETLAGGDVVNQYLPYKHLLKEQLLAGRLPLWNPLTFAGRPLQADVQTGLFYPPNLFFWALPLERAFDLATLAHLALGAWGMALWMRRRVRGAASACLAGAVYAFGGWATTRLEPGIVLFHFAAAWTPWMLLNWDGLLEAARREDRKHAARRFAALVGLVALAVLAGAPQIAFYALVVFGLYVVVMGWGSRLSDGESDPTASPVSALEGWGGAAARFLPVRPGPFLAFLGIGALAGGLCAVQLLPTAAFIERSWDRSGEGGAWEYVVDGSFAPRMALTFAAPEFFGEPADEARYWGGRTGYHETTAYLGAAPLLLLALFAAFRLRRAMRRDWFAGLGADRRRDAVRFEVFCVLLIVLAALFVCGRWSPFYWIAYHVVPGFDRFRVPARMLYFLTFGAAALAGWTLERSANLLDMSGPVRRGAVRTFSAVALAGAAGFAALWLAAPALMRALGAPAAGGPVWTLVLADARFSVLRVGLAWCAAGGAALALATPAVRRSPRLRTLLLWTFVVAASLDLLGHGAGFLRTAPRGELRAIMYPETQRVAFLKENLSPGERFLWFDSVLSWRFDQNQPELLTNRPIMHGLPELRGYDPVNSRLYGLTANAMAAGPLTRNPGGFMFIPDDPADEIDWRLIGLWNCRIALSYAELDDPAVERVREWFFPPEAPGAPSGTLRAYRLKRTSGDARLCEPAVLPAGTPPEAFLSVLKSPEFPAWEKALIAEHDLQFAQTQASAEAPEILPARAAVETLERGPGVLRVRAESPGPALLVFPQVWSPAWLAEMNGVATEVFPVNASQCGVWTPAGVWDVTLRRGAENLRRGALVSLLSLCVGLLVWRRIRREAA